MMLNELKNLVLTDKWFYMDDLYFMMNIADTREQVHLLELKKETIVVKVNGFNEINIKNIRANSLVINCNQIELVRQIKGYLIQELNLASNRIHTIDSEAFSNLNGLKKLVLDDNIIGELDRSLLLSLTSLTSLSLKKNRLIMLQDELFEGLVNLIELDLESNLIDKLNENTFKGLRSLETLKLGFNCIVSIDSATFASLIYLSELDLKYNFLIELDPNLLVNNLSLCKFSIESNFVSELDPSFFSSNMKLKLVCLIGNRFNRRIYDKSMHGDDVVFEEHPIVNCVNSKKSKRRVNLIRTRRGKNLPRIRNVSLIKHIKDKSRVKDLDLSRNHLIGFDTHVFDLFARLESLDLSFNSIKSLPSKCFESLSTLGKINLSHNQLVELNADTFQGLIRLKQIDLSFNKLKHLNDESLFKTNIRLNQINLNGNRLTRIDENLFVECDKISVDLSMNRLRSIKLNKLTISSINLKFNRIKAAKFESTSAADALHFSNVNLANNNLGDLNANLFSYEPNLIELNFSFNQITKINKSFIASNQSLMILDLSFNLLKTFDLGCLTRLRRLKNLHLGGNNLKSIRIRTGKSKFSKDSLVKSLENVRIADEMNNNGKRRVNLGEMRMNRLRELHLSHNSIDHLGGDDDPRLMTMTSIPIQSIFTRLKFGSLVKLDLSYNNLIKLDEPKLFESMISLQILRLNSNKLEHIDSNMFASLTKLTYLNLANNRLTKVDDWLLLKQHKLKYLSLRDNKLVYLNARTLFYNCRKLKKLNLSKNQLTNESVNANAFEAIKFSLERLNLNHNQLRQIHLMREMKCVRELFVRGNSIDMEDELNVRALETNKKLGMSQQLRRRFQKSKTLPYYGHSESSASSK